MEEFEKVPVLQESGFRQLFENCPVGVALYTLDERRIALANPSMHRMLGYAPGELSGKHWTEFTHPDDIERQEAQMVDIIISETFTLRKRYLSRDGQTVWADIFGSLLRDSQGEPSYHVGIIVDCGQRVSAENALRESEALFRSLVENIPDGISRFDRDHRLLFLDSTIAQHLGLDVSTSLGFRLKELALPEYLASPFADAIDRVFASGRPAELGPVDIQHSLQIKPATTSTNAA